MNFCKQAGNCCAISTGDNFNLKFLFGVMPRIVVYILEKLIRKITLLASCVGFAPAYG